MISLKSNFPDNFKIQLRDKFFIFSPHLGQGLFKWPLLCRFAVLYPFHMSSMQIACGPVGTGKRSSVSSELDLGYSRMAARVNVVII
jgi:hypothetical protein